MEAATGAEDAEKETQPTYSVGDMVELDWFVLREKNMWYRMATWCYSVSMCDMSDQKDRKKEE